MTETTKETNEGDAEFRSHFKFIGDQMKNDPAAFFSTITYLQFEGLFKAIKPEEYLQETQNERQLRQQSINIAFQKTIMQIIENHYPFINEINQVKK